MTRRVTCLAGLLFVALHGAFAAGNLDEILARMDQNATKFKRMRAKVRYLSHNNVIQADDISTGTMSMKRSKKDVQFVVDFTAPDPKAVALSGTRVEIYYPKMQTVEEYDLGKSREMAEKFLTLGFGASGADMKSDYALRELGPEPLAGQNAFRLELIPKSKQVLQQVPKIEMWISESTGYPMQHKIYQTGGDYMLVTYSDVSINPSLPDSAFKLTLPKDVKRVVPGK